MMLLFENMCIGIAKGSRGLRYWKVYVVWGFLKWKFIFSATGFS